MRSTGLLDVVGVRQQPTVPLLAQPNRPKPPYNKGDTDAALSIGRLSFADRKPEGSYNEVVSEKKRHRVTVLHSSRAVDFPMLCPT